MTALLSKVSSILLYLKISFFILTIHTKIQVLRFEDIPSIVWLAMTFICFKHTFSFLYKNRSIFADFSSIY